MPPWLPKINSANRVSKHIVYFLFLLVKSESWSEPEGSFWPAVAHCLPAVVLRSLVASLFLVTVHHKVVVLFFNFLFFILRTNIH